MTSRVLGKAEYQAHRTGRLVTVTATGEFPNFNDKADFEQLPFRIFPPEYGFYFIHQDIRIPTVKPFCYSEVIAFPTNAPFIIIVDADGSHNIPLKEIQIEEPVKEEPAKSEKGFCVFQNINGSSLSIAKCDVILPAIYRKVFGPASYQECEKYVSDNRGTNG
jgi:hypothetical protein